MAFGGPHMACDDRTSCRDRTHMACDDRMSMGTSDRILRMSFDFVESYM